MSRITERDEHGNATVVKRYSIQRALNKLAAYEDMEIPPADTNVLTHALTTYGSEAQVDMMIEEMSELTKALLKQRRAQKSSYQYDREHVKAIIEEMADVYIVLLQMIQLFGEPSLFKEYVKDKMLRLRLRLLEEMKEAAEDGE